MQTSLTTFINGLRNIGTAPVLQPPLNQGLANKPSPLEELTTTLEQVGRTHQQFFRDIEEGSRNSDSKEAISERSSAFFNALAKSFRLEISSSGFTHHRERGVISCTLEAENDRNSYRINFRKDEERFVFDSLEVSRKSLPKPPSLKLEDLSKMLCEQDKSSPRAAELMKDPSIQSLPTIHRRLLTLEADGSISPSKTSRNRAELGAWIARNLHFSGAEPTPERIVEAVKEIENLQKTHGRNTLFHGRTAVFLAHQETLADVFVTDEKSRKERPLNQEELRAYRRGVGDDRMFGRDSVIEGIRQQLGDAKALTLFRAEDKLSFGLLKLARTHQDTLSRWHISDGEKNAPTIGEVSALKADLRRILALPAEEAISVSYQGAAAGSGASLVVRRKDEVLLRSSLLTGDDGSHKDISVTQAPKILPPSPSEAKEAALRAIGTTTSGNEGFVFVFEGHGSGSHLYLSEGNPRPGGFFEKPMTVRISAEELALALSARDKHASHQGPAEGAKPDVVVLKCCFGVDFARNVSDHMKRLGATPPIFICQSEYGQYGYSALNHPMSPFQKALFPPSTTPRTISDLIRIFAEHGNFDSNPTILVPSPGPGKALRQISSLSQPLKEDSPTGTFALLLPPAHRALTSGNR